MRRLQYNTLDKEGVNRLIHKCEAYIVESKRIMASLKRDISPSGVQLTHNSALVLRCKTRRGMGLVRLASDLLVKVYSKMDDKEEVQISLLGSDGLIKELNRVLSEGKDDK